MGEDVLNSFEPLRIFISSFLCGDEDLLSIQESAKMCTIGTPTSVKHVFLAVDGFYCTLVPHDAPLSTKLAYSRHF